MSQNNTTQPLLCSRCHMPVSSLTYIGGKSLTEGLCAKCYEIEQALPPDCFPHEQKWEALRVKIESEILAAVPQYKTSILAAGRLMALYDIKKTMEGLDAK